MDAHEAIKQAVNGHYEAIAKAVGRSANLVYRWTLPTSDFSDSGAYSDLDRLESLIEKTLTLGTPPAQAFAPIYRLAHRFGGYFIPPAPRAYAHKDLARQLTRTMKEVGEALAVTASALEDDALTPNERRQILKEAQEGMHELAQLVAMVERGGEGER